MRTDSRDAAAIGRRARVELVFETRGNRTIATHAYAEPPFRIGRIFHVDDTAYVILVCTGPGVFAGDTLRQSIRVRCGARVMLASQSALQIHPTASPYPARIVHEYEVDDGGELHCHWDPIIPFAGARVEQRFDIRVGAASRLQWSDALMAGRVARGEEWAFTKLAHELRLAAAPPDQSAAPILQYLERYRIAPEERPVTHPWIAAGARYLSTTLIRHAGATSDAAEALHRELELTSGVCGAVDAVEPGLIVARLMAAGGTPFAHARAALRSSALQTIFRSPDLVGRK